MERLLVNTISKLSPSQKAQYDITSKECQKLADMTYKTWGVITKDYFDIHNAMYYALGGLTVGGGILIYKLIKNHKQSED